MNDELALQHERIAVAQTVKHKLLDSGSVSFSYLASLLEAHQLNDNEKADLAGAFMSKIQTTFEHGQFRDLEGGEKLAQILGIGDIALNESTVSRINELLDKYSYGFLIAMSPPLFNGRLHTGEEYGKIKYVKKMVADKDGSMSTEEAEELWKYREMLIKLHSTQQRLSARQNLLDVPKLLLKE